MAYDIINGVCILGYSSDSRAWRCISVYRPHCPLYSCKCQWNKVSVTVTNSGMFERRYIPHLLELLLWIYSFISVDKKKKKFHASTRTSVILTKRINNLLNLFCCLFLSGGGPCNFTTLRVSVSRPSVPSRRRTLNPLLLVTLTVTRPAWSRSTGTTGRQRYLSLGKSMEGTISNYKAHRPKLLRLRDSTLFTAFCTYQG